VATLSGCGSSAAPFPAAASHIYAIQYTTNGPDDSYQCSVLTFPVTASGASATPSATLTLPVGFDAYSLAVGPTGNLYVGGSYYDSGAPSQILIYAAGATGSAQPVSALTGGTPGTFDYPDFMTVNSQGKLFIMDDEYWVVGFNPGAQSGDLPQQFITTYETAHKFSWGIGADDAGNIYLADEDSGEMDVFAAGATGAATPIRTATNATANFYRIYGMAASHTGVVTVANWNYEDDPSYPYVARPGSLLQHRNLPPHLRQRLMARMQAKATVQQHPNTLPTAASGIYVFPAGASGATTPTVTLSGSATGIVEPENLATDAVGNIYYTDANTGYYNDGQLPKVMVFSAGATGNVAPASSFTCSDFVHDWADIIAVF